MKRKIFVFVCTLVMTLTAITIPSDIKVEATGGGGDYPAPGLNQTYIYKKTGKLSEIVEDPLYEWRSREFGEPGEEAAADLIEKWMDDLDLYNVHQDTINTEWTKDDAWDNDHYIGPLAQKRQVDQNDYYLNIYVKDRHGNIVSSRNFNYEECFPFLKGWYEGHTYESAKTDRVFDRFMWSYRGNQIVYFKNEQWSPKPYAFWDDVLGKYEGRPQEWVIKPYILSRFCRGFIVSDYFTDTWFMSPSYNDHWSFFGLKPGTKANFIKAGFSINGDGGDWLEDYLKNPLCYKVYAQIKSYCDLEWVTSKNVIGQINVPDSETVSIVCAHYDSWWSQATIDEGAETALVLGIAKYIKEKELKLKHTVKFIAFTGEENGMRGVKHYIKENNLDTDDPTDPVMYVINPGNFGHEDVEDQDGEPLVFKFASPEYELRELADKIADFLEYEERTSIHTTTYNGTQGEDSAAFSKKDCAEGTISFGRWPYKGYHRGGNTTDVGDVMDILDEELFEVECEVVASVALHCTADSEHRFENVSFTPFDLDYDGNNDSVYVVFNITTDTNTPLLGRVRGCLYDSNSDKVFGSERQSSLYMLEKNETENGCFTFRLPYNYSCGDYTLRLNVMDYWDDVDDECNGTVYLCPWNKPVAVIDYSMVSLKTCNFYDISTPSINGSIVSWNWSFGDGNYSSQQNTSHTFFDNGTYDVILTVWDSNNLSNNTQMSLFVDNAAPSASINVSSNVFIVDDSISFNSTSSDSDGTIVNWTWDFDDGNFNNSAGPAHSYSNSGIYIVNLSVTDDDGSIDTITTTMVIADALTDDNAQDDPDNHTWDTVQEAINDVQDDDIVYIYNGVYNESITVNKSVCLYGEGKELVTIQGTGNVVDIISDSVRMDGLKIKGGGTDVLINGVDNCTITNCIVSDSFNGIKIASGSENNTISHCNFSSNSYGVFISGSYNWIGSQSLGQLSDNCYFNHNTYGIYIDNSHDNMIMGCNIKATWEPYGPPLLYGICLDDSENNSIFFCNVSNASHYGYGIYLDDSTGNYICHNLIFNNSLGVFLTSSSDNRVAMNNISNNEISGITIIMMSSSNNSVYWNDFVSNGHGISPQASDDGSGNHWNSSGNETLNYVSAGEGNYWSDYNGVDNDGDGIGDTPYSIAGIANAVDDYPVMKANDFF